MVGVALRGDAGTAIAWVRPWATTTPRIMVAGGMAGVEKEPIKYFFCNLPETYTLRRLVRLAKCRWKIEQDYQQLKEELGLDHYEGRSWIGWHHHTTLVMMAHAFLTLQTLRRKKTSGWTLPQTRREIQYLLITWTGVCALYSDPARLKEFLRAMTGVSHSANLAIARQFQWSQYHTVVDVGTAQGDLINPSGFGPSAYRGNRF